MTPHCIRIPPTSIYPDVLLSTITCEFVKSKNPATLLISNRVSGDDAPANRI